MMVRSMMERYKTNDHHTAHNAGFWEGHYATRGIRENPSLIVQDMDVKAHNFLHKMTAAVPTPSIHVAQFVVTRLDRDFHVLDGIDEYSRLVEQAIKHPRCKEIEKKLAHLSIEAMRAQIPYIRDTQPKLYLS